MTERKKTLDDFGRLLDIMDRLRVECPWDRKQTWDSLRTLSIEETYELSDAILKKEPHEIAKELGDILLHIVFYAKMGDEEKLFDMDEVICRLCDKLIYRHPHVFGQVHVENATEVLQNWEQLKLKEKEGNRSVLAGVPQGLPAMVKAYRIQDKVSAVGFDWEKKEQVWNKVKEEAAEFLEEDRKHDRDRMEAEFGDLLFALVNAARLYDINPETALERTNRKFIKRFDYLESQTIDKGRSLKDMSLAEMDVFWEEAKKFE